jgi:hypothetical protein
MSNEYYLTRFFKDHLPDQGSDTIKILVSELTRLLNEAEERGRNEAVREIGSRGGKKGGPARAAKMSPQQRKQWAKDAAKKRWNK